MAGLVIGNFSYHTLSEGNGQIQPVFPQALHHGASTPRIIFPLYINTCFFKRRIFHSLVMNMRSYFGRNRRAQAMSKDGGIIWTAPEDVPDLIEPVCQASVVRYSWPEQNQESILVFSNPAATSRENMTIKLSYDEGKTWPVGRSLYEGPSAYSSLTVLPNGQIGCLYERGTENPYETIVLARFPLTWLQDDKINDNS